MFFTKLMIVSFFLSLLEAQGYPTYLTQHDEWWDFSGWIDQGYCTSLRCPSWITLVEGKPTTFSILAYDYKCGLVHCNQTGQNCENCTMCRFYSGSPLVFRVTVMDQDGNPAPSTTCTVANYDISAYGVYPVSCTARNNLAGTLRYYYVNLEFDPSHIPSDAELQRPIPSEILATTINTHPAVLFAAGRVNPPSCIGSWLNSVSTFEAGEVAWYIVKQTDAFGNIAFENTGSSEIVTFNYKFMSSAKDSIDVPGGVHQAGYSCAGCYALTFVPQLTGSFELHLSVQGQQIQNVPATFKVNAGSINISTSKGGWKDGVNTFQLGSIAVLKATICDSFQNLASISSSFTLLAVFLDANLTQLGNIPYTTSVDLTAAQMTFSFAPVWGIGRYYLQIGSSTENIQNSPFSFTTTAGSTSVAASRGKWYNSVNTIVAGATAYLTVEQMDAFGHNIPVNDAKDIFKFTVSVVNYPSAISKFSLNVTLDENVAGNVAIQFNPTQIGQFSLYVGSEGNAIIGAPFPFIVVAGPVYVPACEGSWLFGSTFVAGAQASFQVLQKDKQGNVVSVASGSSEVYPFSLSTIAYNNSMSKILDIESGLQTFNFIPTVAGNFTLRVSSTSLSQDISNGPLRFSVSAGSISISACTGSWYNGRNQVTTYSKLELVLLLFDAFTNAVSAEEAGTVNFIATSVQVGRHVPSPVQDLIITPLVGSSAVTNQLLLSFIPSQIGEYTLQVGDGTHFIKGSGSHFSVFPQAIQSAGGSLIQGAGLGNTYAGELSEFVIYLKDSLGSPTSEHDDTLSVVITATQTQAGVPVVVDPSDDTLGEYFVTYNATIAGLYNIYVAWNATVLADNYKKMVFPGRMNPRSCTASGAGIQGGTAGDSLAFEIHLLDRYNNSVTAFETKPFINIRPDRVVSMSVGNGGNNGIIVVKYALALAQPEPYMLSVSVGSVTPGDPISGSPFSVHIRPGNVAASMCKGEWQNAINTFTVGVPANFVIRQADVNGNAVFAVAGSTLFYVKAQNVVSGSEGTILSIAFKPLGNGSQEMLLLSFTMHEAGNYLLQLKAASADLPGSFPFTFYPGQVSIGNCTGGWYNKISTFRVGGVANFVFVVRDVFGNTISASVKDLFPQIDHSGVIVTPSNPKIVSLGSSSAQLVSFFLTVSGQFDLKIGDKMTGTFSASYPFTYLSGDLYAPKCSGLWLGGNQTFPVDTPAIFVVTLRDQYSNPLSSEVAANMTAPGLVPKLFKLGVHLLVNMDAVFRPVSNTNSSSYSLVFNVSEPGNYNLYVESGSVGILGSPFAFTATTGAPNVSSSLVSGVGLSSKASINYWDEIDVSMKDSLGNPTATDISLLTFEITGAGHVDRQDFVDMGGGKYVMFYRPLTPGKFIISLSLQGHHFSGSPFEVTVGTLNGSSILEWPHVSSTPNLLDGIEGAVVSCQRENSYFEVSFINITASVIVEVAAENGRVFLPTSMYLPGSHLVIWPSDPTHPGRLKFSGPIGPSNQALLALLYQGDKHFNGKDVVSVTVSDTEGHEDTDTATVQLDPYNDPPFIDVPDAVKIATNKGAVVPPIVVGDPDDTDVDGQALELEITLRVQGGSLVLSLPKHINYATPAEMNSEAFQTRPMKVNQSPYSRQRNSFHFHAVSFGSIGIVFRATVMVCNDALATLQFEPDERSGIPSVLYIAVDDLGNFGCYGSCDSDVPYPLYVEANVTIVPFSASLPRRLRTIWGSTIGALGFVGLVTGLLVWVKQRYFRKLRVALQADEGEEEDYKELRTYNPIWKPEAERAASILQPDRILKYAHHVADEVDGPDIGGPELVHVLQKRVSTKLAALPEIQEAENVQSARRPTMLGQVVGEEETANISFEYDAENFVRALNRTWTPAAPISAGTYTLDDANRPRLSVPQSSPSKGLNVSGQQQFALGPPNVQVQPFGSSVYQQLKPIAGSSLQPESSGLVFEQTQYFGSPMPPQQYAQDKKPPREIAPSWEDHWGDESGWA